MKISWEIFSFEEGRRIFTNDRLWEEVLNDIFKGDFFMKEIDSIWTGDNNEKFGINSYINAGIKFVLEERNLRAWILSRKRAKKIIW